jgi:hypothetical protein
MLMAPSYMLFDSRAAFDAALAAIDDRDGFASAAAAGDVTTSWAPVLRDSAGKYVLEVPPAGIPDGLAGYTVGQPSCPCAVEQ